MKKPKIIIPIKNIEKIEKSDVEYVEVRADFMKNEEILENMRYIRKMLIDKKIIFTYRTKSQGGMGVDSADFYMKIIDEVSNENLADIYDIEGVYNINYLENLIESLHNKNKKVIFSYHNFSNDYDIKLIEEVVQKFEKLNADILKIAINVEKNSEIIDFLYFTKDIRKRLKNKEFIFISMGKKGMITRIFNTDYTFSYIEEKSADGQIEYEMMKKILEAIY